LLGATQGHPQCLLLSTQGHPQCLLLSTLRLKEGSESPKPCRRSPTFAPRLPLAVAEQDHQFGGAKKFERKCCLKVTCQRTHTKTGRCAHYLLENEPIFCLLAWLISQPLVLSLSHRPSLSLSSPHSSLLAGLPPAPAPAPAATATTAATYCCCCCSALCPPAATAGLRNSERLLLLEPPRSFRNARKMRFRASACLK
jgi:hypothetical protein